MYNNESEYVVNGKFILQFLKDNKVDESVINKLDNEFFTDGNVVILEYRGGDIYRVAEEAYGGAIDIDGLQFYDILNISRNYIGDTDIYKNIDTEIEDAIDKALGLNKDDEDDNYESQELQDFEGIGIECEYLGSDE